MLATLIWISRSSEQGAGMLAQKADILQFIASVGTTAPFSFDRPIRGNVCADSSVFSDDDFCRIRLNVTVAPSLYKM